MSWAWQIEVWGHVQISFTNAASKANILDSIHVFLVSFILLLTVEDP
jgi:hypothetical protein